MKITYAVTVCNEFIEIQRLIKFLLENKRIQDEIVVQMDLNLDDINSQPEDKRQVFAYVMKCQELGHIKAVLWPLNNHFADFKNHLTDQCTGDWIFQIDADEVPTVNLIQHLPDIIHTNSQVEVMLIPRINTVEGLTPDHIQQWGWNVNDQGWINWPDYQWRIWKNKPEIRWINKVHERLDGFLSYATIPEYESLALWHLKTIDRQIKQNDYYEQL